MERQVGKLGSIRADHLYRYIFASEQLKKQTVLDAACGCGYGSWILAHDNAVTGVDIEPEAIDFARAEYFGPKYILGDILKKPWRAKTFEAVVSFETLEHLSDPEQALLHFRDSASLLIASVPNEERYPFVAEKFAQDKYPHLRHYTPDEFVQLLEETGWTVQSMHTQENKLAKVSDGTQGIFIIAVCV